jgi:hypothetical protein
MDLFGASLIFCNQLSNIVRHAHCAAKVDLTFAPRDQMLWQPKIAHLPNPLRATVRKVL